jgi:maltose/maltodextrin transport system substrate-binding protein
LKESDAHPEYIGLAKELIRFAEDQFVVWEPGDPALSYPWFREDSKWNGTVLEGGSDWFIPCALEQYKFYTPIARSSQLMILAYLEAYRVTGESIYHAKAVALANALTLAQAYHGGGEIPTHLRKNLPEANWLNNGVYPAITLIENAEILSKELD